MTDNGRTTRVEQHVAAPADRVWAALLDPTAVQAWLVPDGMTSTVHEYDAREGGAFRVSLTYDGEGAGKSGARTDTYGGRFVRLVPGREVVQVVEFETEDAGVRGEMTVRYLLAEDGGGTLVTGVHEDLPPAVSLADNELGWRMSLGKLAALVEGQTLRR